MVEGEDLEVALGLNPAEAAEEVWAGAAAGWAA